MLNPGQVQICDQMIQQRFNSTPMVHGFNYYQNTGSVASCQATCLQAYTQGTQEADLCQDTCTDAPSLCGVGYFDLTANGCAPFFGGQLSELQKCNNVAGTACTTSAIHCLCRKRTARGVVNNPFELAHKFKNPKFLLSFFCF